jgi:regulator of sigma E protease
VDFKAALDSIKPKPINISLTKRFINWISGQSVQPTPPVLTSLLVNRKGENLTLQVEIDKSGTIGFVPELLIKTGLHKYGFLESVPRGSNKAFGVITGQIKAFGKMFRQEISAYESVGGPIEIAKQYGGQWIWERFWILTGSLSMVLAFMNLLPIPALDGGHVLFLLYEMIAGRKPSDAFLENAQKVGTLLILSLMLFVLVIKPVLGAFSPTP